MKTVLEKTTAQPGSGRDAFSAFSQGEGNVLLTYENEAIKAEKEGEEVEYVIPPYTMQIETPIAVTKEAPEPAAEEFLKFLWSNEGQELWAENGYRPVNPKLVDPKQFPAPEKACSRSAKFGGWGKVKDEFFDEETGSVAKIEEELGVSDLRLIDGGPRRTAAQSHHPGQAFRLPGVGAGLGRGVVVLYLSVIVLLPLAALLDKSLERRARPLLGPGHPAAGGRLAGADPGLLADRRR